MSPDEIQSSAPKRPVPPTKCPRPAGQVFKSSRRTPPAGAARLKPTDKVALLKARGPNNPTPEELATLIARDFFNPDAGTPDDALPLPVRIVFEELVFALRALSEVDRAAALAYIATEFPKRTAG